MLVVGLVYLASAAILPFPNWTSFLIVAHCTVTARRLGLRARLGMIRYLVREVAVLPVWTAFWIVDEVLFCEYRNASINEPIFIFSQPRSGTTFLLRTLAEDTDTFLGVKHLEWRYPYISFWRLIDALGLRQRIEALSYWPANDLGRLCHEIHPHVLGNHEEFGIFLEERFFHHYFVFRRFPFLAVLNRVSRFEDLSPRAQERMVTTFLRVVRKVHHYRQGGNRIFLAKENENVEFCCALIKRLPDARLIFIARATNQMLRSYLTMSVTCTEVKHGVKPQALDGWHEANMRFRREECRRFIGFWDDVHRQRRSVLLSFHDLTRDVEGTIRFIYRRFELSVKPAFGARLAELQREQDRRAKGYENMPCEEEGFEFFDHFVSCLDRRLAVERCAS